MQHVSTAVLVPACDPDPPPGLRGAVLGRCLPKLVLVEPEAVVRRSPQKPVLRPVRGQRLAGVHLDSPHGLGRQAVGLRVPSPALCHGCGATTLLPLAGTDPVAVLHGRLAILSPRQLRILLPIPNAGLRGGAEAALFFLILHTADGTARQKLKKDHPEAKHVDFPVVMLIKNQLGGHVIFRAADRHLPGRRLLVEGPSHAEVRDLALEGSGEQEVAAFDVPVNLSTGVQVLQPHRRVVDDPHPQEPRDVVLALEELKQVASPRKLGDDPKHVRGLSNLLVASSDQPEDVLMVAGLQCVELPQLVPL
eukprot:scaffold1642_cov252-Pinguiococcus_pyrenoidosus.AAC.27